MPATKFEDVSELSCDMAAKHSKFQHILQLLILATTINYGYLHSLSSSSDEAYKGVGDCWN
jgi:hypothetical protein